MFDNFTRYLLKLLREDQMIKYHGQHNELDAMMRELMAGKTENKEFICKRIGANKYSIEPIDNDAMFFDLLIFSFTQDSDITVTLYEKEEKLQLIHCSGKIKVVHFSIILFFLATIYYQIVHSGDGLSYQGWILIIVFWGIFHWVLNVFWSTKERQLMQDFKMALFHKMRRK